MGIGEEWLTVGKVVAPQGLQGELRVLPNSDFPERFTKPGERWLKANKTKPREVQLISGRKLPGKLIYVIRLAHINNRNEAQSIVGQRLLVPAAKRPKLAKGEFHFLDLVGLEVRLEAENLPIGKVTDLIKGGNDLIEIELFSGKKVLVPFVKEIVPEVKITEGFLSIAPPPGLLEL